MSLPCRLQKQLPHRLVFVIEIFFSDKFFRSELKFVAHQIVARVLQDSLLSVVRSLKSFKGGSKRAISAG